jgi:AcrR family transcriptional regulator
VSTRERLLDATEACLRRDGIRRTTVAQVAEEAGISRAWLYRHYPDKASLVGAAIVRLDEAYWAAAHTEVAAEPGLTARVVRAVQLGRALQPRPLVMALRDAEPEAFAAVVGTGVREIVPGLAGFWHRYLQQAVDLGEVRADLDVPRAAEWVLRIVISLATVPGDAVDADDPASLRMYVQEFLVPGLR